jgi:Tfp pilus assembly protein PilO
VDKNRLWVIGAILVMVAIIAAGWFLGIQPQLATAAAADQSRSTTQVQNTVNETLLASLKKDYSNIGTLKTQLASLQDSVPESAEISAFVTELDALAGAHQATVTAITVADAKAYAPPVAAVPAPAPGATATPAPTPSPTAAPVAPAAPVGTLRVTNPKITAANFVAIPVQLSITGQYSNVLDFVNGLQMGPRLFLVTSLSITTPAATAKTTGSSVESNIGGFIYVLLQKGTTAATTPAG